MAIFSQPTTPQLDASAFNDAYVLTARMLGIVGTGFCAGAMLSNSYFTMPGLLTKNSNASEAAKEFFHMTGRSTFWLNRLSIPAAAAFSYAAYHAPTHPTKYINPKSMLTVAAISVALVMPYHYFKMSTPAKRLSAGGEAAEISDEKKMEIVVVDDALVKKDLHAWTVGNTTRGWLVLVSFLLGTTVEVFYL